MAHVMKPHQRKRNKSVIRRIGEAGNVFLMLFGAVGMVGVLGASTMTVMKGPVRTMAVVTKRTIAENNMIATGKLALIAAAAQTVNDCDGDSTIEPIGYETIASGGISGGGGVPSTIGAAKQDPWGKDYGYCTWDHGSLINDAACTGNYQTGLATEEGYVLAVVSAGPDGSFDTTCDVGGSFTKAAASDDIVLGYTYAEASSIAAGLWNIKSSDPDVAEINRDLEVKDSSDTVQLAFDTTAGDLTIGNAGNIPSVNTDFISTLAASEIDILSPVKDLTVNDDITSVSGDITATAGNMSAIDGTFSGDLTMRDISAKPSQAEQISQTSIVQDKVRLFYKQPLATMQD